MGIWHTGKSQLDWQVLLVLAGRNCYAQEVPKEFRENVVRFALSRDRDVSLAQIARDFGIHVGTLDKWLRQDRIDNGDQEGVNRKESQQMRQLRRRNRLLEQENEILRRAGAYLSLANTVGKGLPRS